MNPIMTAGQAIPSYTVHGDGTMTDSNGNQYDSRGNLVAGFAPGDLLTSPWTWVVGSALIFGIGYVGYQMITAPKPALAGMGYRQAIHPPPPRRRSSNRGRSRR